MKKAYENILEKEYTGQRSRPRMSLYERAAQFAPFAALDGYSDIIEETASEVDSTSL